MEGVPFQGKCPLPIRYHGAVAVGDTFVALYYRGNPTKKNLLLFDYPVNRQWEMGQRLDSVIDEDKVNIDLWNY